MSSFKIKPDLPPELKNNMENETALENKNCIKFLREKGVSKGTLLNWSPGMDQKKVQLFIPSENFTGTPVVIKFLRHVEDHSLLLDQTYDQIQNLDMFVASLGFSVSDFQLYFLFVDIIEKDEKCESNSQIEKIKVGLLSKCRNAGLRSIRVKRVDHTSKDGTIYKKMANKNSPQQKTQSLNGFLQEAASADRGSSSNLVLQHLVKHVPEYSYLHFSEQEYNSSDSEANKGFTLCSVQQVADTFGRFFWHCTEEVCIFPEFDHATNSVLERTNERTGFLEVRTSNDFTGEEIDFVEKVLDNLNEPRGLLIRDYSEKRLNAILQAHYSLNFQFDWILFSDKKLYAIEVSRCDNITNPYTTVCTKIKSVFSTSFPKLGYILASMLCNGSKQFTVEERRNFLHRDVSFIIYFANLSVTEINRVLKILTYRQSESDDNAREALAQLKRTPSDVMQRIFVMSSEETASKTKAPDLYYFTSTDSVWHLEKSNISTQKIFSCNPFTSWSKIIQFAAGLFTFGFLISNCCIQKPQSDQILPWNSKIISEHCKLQKRIPHPQLVLSPQQLRILEENKRRIYIVGEPGTGKTMLLLAKMFEAAKDPNVDHVLFFYPDAKSEFSKLLKKFVQESIERYDKVHIVTSSKICAVIRNLNLSRAVILGDEFYFDPNNDFSDSSSSSFLRSTKFLSWVPQTKQCWLANTEAGQDNRKSVHRISLPHFNTEELNVLFRCSWHIGRFCTLVLHRNKAISKSSAWVFGCTKSSQSKVFYDYYTNWGSLNEKIKTCRELRSKFDHDRMTVIFSSAGNEAEWYMRFVGNQKKIGQIFVVNDRMGFYDLPFTGIEKNSVLLIIESSTGTENEILKYSLAASRAQFELCILVQQGISEKTEPFLKKCETSVFDEVVTSARLGLPVDLHKIAAHHPGLLLPRIVTLLQIAIERQNLTLVQTIAQLYRSEMNKIDLLQLFLAMDKRKGKKFLAGLAKIFGTMIVSHFDEVISRVHKQLLEDQPFINVITDMANIAARMGLLANVDWIIGMIGKEGGNFFGQHSGKIIFYACNNGSFKAIEWGVRTVEKYGSLQKELEATYNTWDGQKTTLLLFLCHMNIDDMQPIKLLREKGFPANLLLIKYETRNVLEKSLFYKNYPMAEELLKDNLWARTLIPSRKELIKLIKQVKNNANQSAEPVNTDLLNLLNTRFEATRICRY